MFNRKMLLAVVFGATIVSCKTRQSSGNVKDNTASLPYTPPVFSNGGIENPICAKPMPTMMICISQPEPIGPNQPGIFKFGTINIDKGPGTVSKTTALVTSIASEPNHLLYTIPNINSRDDTDRDVIGAMYLDVDFSPVVGAPAIGGPVSGNKATMSFVRHSDGKSFAYPAVGYNSFTLVLESHLQEQNQKQSPSCDPKYEAFLTSVIYYETSPGAPNQPALWQTSGWKTCNKPEPTLKSDEGIKYAKEVETTLQSMKRLGCPLTYQAYLDWFCTNLEKNGLRFLNGARSGTAN